MTNPSARPTRARFVVLVVDAAEEGADGTCIEGGQSRADAEFFTVYGRLTEGGCEVITDCDDFDEAQRVAAHLCGVSGLTLEVLC